MILKLGQEDGLYAETPALASGNWKRGVSFIMPLRLTLQALHPTFKGLQ